MTRLVAVFSFIVALTSCSLLQARLDNVPTGSMANTIVPGDTVVISTEVGQIKRGDLVIFKLPPKPEVNYIKRIIGMPGETIQMKGMKVFINGRELPERRVMIALLPEQHRPYKELSSEGSGAYSVYYDQNGDHSEEGVPGMEFGVKAEYKIPTGHYFVLGDCRDNALDSRFWGTVPAENIIGRPVSIRSSVDNSAKPPKPRPERAGLKLQ
jgi:signal peptidase I